MKAVIEPLGAPEVPGLEHLTASAFSAAAAVFGACAVVLTVLAISSKPRP